MDPLKLVGKNLARVRLAKGLSQTQLANRIDPSKLLIAQSYISKIERGEKNITIYTLNMLAEALDTHLTELFKDL